MRKIHCGAVLICLMAALTSPSSWADYSVQVSVQPNSGAMQSNPAANANFYGVSAPVSTVDNNLSNSPATGPNIAQSVNSAVQSQCNAYLQAYMVNVPSGQAPTCPGSSS